MSPDEPVPPFVPLSLYEQDVLRLFLGLPQHSVREISPRFWTTARELHRLGLLHQSVDVWSAAPAAIHAINLYPIDRGVPIPPARPGSTAHRNLPFDRLSPGDSFFVPAERPAETQRYIASLLLRHCIDKNFVTRQVPGGVRVWRTK